MRIFEFVHNTPNTIMPPLQLPPSQYSMDSNVSQSSIIWQRGIASKKLPWVPLAMCLNLPMRDNNLVEMAIKYIVLGRKNGHCYKAFAYTVTASDVTVSIVLIRRLHYNNTVEK